MPSKRHNPTPEHDSNTPEALNTLPVYEPYGTRWGRKQQLGCEVVQERTPLLALRAPAPVPDEEAVITTTDIEAALSSPSPPSLLVRVVDCLRGALGRLVSLFSSPRSPPSSPSPAPAGPATAPASPPSSRAFLRIPVPSTTSMNSANFPSTVEAAVPARPPPSTNWTGSPWRTGDYDG